MEQQNAAGAPATRPTFLTVLCILSFIWMGIAAVMYIIAMLAFGAVTAVVSSDAVQNSLDSLGDANPEGMAAVNTVASASAGLFWAWLVIGFICLIVSFVGVLKMWKLQKMGFYLYAAAAVISLIMDIVYSGFGIGSLIVPAAFITMYGLNLKHMK